MKILYLSQYFPPEIGATQTRGYEMAKNLISEGHRVTVITEMPNHPKGIIPKTYQGKFKVFEEYDGIPVIRCWVAASTEKTFKNRMLFYLSFMVTAVFNGLFTHIERPDVIYATSPPLFVGMAGLMLAGLYRVPFVFEVRDLWPESAVELGELRRRSFIRIGQKIADMCYRRACGIVPVTQGIYDRLLAKGLSSQKLFLIKNGTNPDNYRYICNEELERRLGWQNKFVVMYAGVHGIAQGLETVLETASRLSAHPEIHFVFIGEGPVKEKLKKIAKELCPDNTEFLPEIPSAGISEYISLADICLVPLKRLKLFEGALPSKIFDYWACNKPILLTIDGEARKELEKARGGIFVEPENVDALSNALINISKNRWQVEKMGYNGYQYILKNGYIRSHQAQKLHKTLNRILKKRSD